MKRILFLAFIVCTVTACTTYSPSPRAVLPAEYSLAWQQIFGHCYDSVACAVVALDLYSDGLSLDKDNRMQGSGYNLYLSDIFVPDSLFEAGSYHSDTTAQPFTFLPGRNWEGTPSGMYLLYVDEGRLQSIQVLDSGMIVAKDTTNGLVDLQFTLYYKNAYGYKTTYTTHFQGALQPWRKQ